MMLGKLTDMDKIRALPWLVVASSANQVFWFLVIAGSVVTLFFNELGLDKSRIGFILSVIPFSQIVGIFAGNMLASIGYKRGFLLFFTLRKIVISLILFCPLILSRYGVDATFYWIVVIFTIFSVLRALAETAWLAWSKELIPDIIRGKFNAINSILATVSSIVVFFVAGYVIDAFEGLNRFIYMIVFGILLGFFAMFCYGALPGGKPEKLSQSDIPGLKDMFLTLKDKNYAIFLAGVGLASFAFSALLSFAPLYLKEKIGITAGVIVWVDIAGMVGSAALVFFWGWASDRYGSKPIMLISLILALLLPIGWIFMPRDTSLSIYFAFGISFISGLAFVGWIVSFMCMYLIKVAVPEEKKSTYMPVFFSFIGIVGGLGPLLAGWLLDVASDLSFVFGFLYVDAFTLLFAFSILFMVLAIKFISMLRPDGKVSAQEFVGMIFQSNPVTTFSNMIRYRWAGNENNRIAIAEKLGASKAMLSSNELIEALKDPSFNVRHEAITAIGRLKPHPKLVDALLLVLGGDQPDLALSAAWSLGKLGDKNAIIPLREILLSEYDLLQARAARALGMLGDTQSIAFMLNKLRTEPDNRLRVAYSSSLGLLNAVEAVDDIMNLLGELEDSTNRAETSLALARLIGSENRYIRLQRRLEKDIATTAAQTVLTLRKVIGFPTKRDLYASKLARESSAELASGNIINGTGLLCELLEQLPLDGQNALSVKVIMRCMDELRKHGNDRHECLLLLLHTVLTSLKPIKA